MKSSLVSRDLIADSVELTMRGHCYDALVGSGRLRQVAARHDDGHGASSTCPRSSCTAAPSCPAATKARTSPCRTSSRRSAHTPPATCRRRGTAQGHRMCGLSLGRFLRRPVHRQHHGLRVGGFRSRAFRGLPAPRRPTSPATPMPRRRAHAVMNAPGPGHPATRPGHPQVAGERGARGRLPPAARPMPACTCRPSRTRPASTSTCTTSAKSFARPLHRGSEAGRQIRRQGSL